MSHPEPTIVVRRHGRIGRITLNRPDALNALDLGMVQSIADALEGWRADPAVHAVVVEGAGGRAFCAGGDIRGLRAALLAGDHAAVEAFFRAEYALNLAIARYPKPYVSLIDGVCMGGGIGLSVHGTARVASERALFAMPEVGIGFFPDVGATYVLPRLRRGWGAYLGLTGARLGGADAAWAGLATHFVGPDRMVTLAEEIAADGIAVLADAALPPPPDAMASLGWDLTPFEAESVEAVVEGLERDGSHWARDTLAALRAASPTAVRRTFAALQRGAGLDLEGCLQMEFALTRHATRHPDFLEGVRAMVVDKDRQPRWTPARLERVNEAAVEAEFA